MSGTATHRPRLPDFIGVGTQRAGTTWLFSALSRDPSYWMPLYKELDFFFPGRSPEVERDRLRVFHQLFGRMLQAGAVDPDALRHLAHVSLPEEHDLDWYRELFAPAGPRCTGDISPSYFLLDEAGVARVAATLPRARAVMVLRDPLDRALSAWRFKMSKGHWAEGMPEDELVATLTTGNAGRFAAYAEAVARWERHFAGRIGIFFYDGLQRSPQQHLAAISRFLRRPASVPPLTAKVNAVRRQETQLPPAVAAAIAPVFRAQLGDLPDRFPDPVGRWAARLDRVAESGELS
jgi:hypothetical protein